MLISVPIAAKNSSQNKTRQPSGFACLALRFAIAPLIIDAMRSAKAIAV
jgi:hypothetical protein